MGIAYRGKGWPLVIIIVVTEQLEQIVQRVRVAALAAAGIILRRNQAFPITTKYRHFKVENVHPEEIPGISNYYQIWAFQTEKTFPLRRLQVSISY